MSDARRAVLFSGSGWHYGDGRINLTDAYILAHAPKRPRVCLIPSAQGDAERIQAQFLRTWQGHDVDLDVATMFNWLPGSRDHKAVIAEADILYFTGGYTVATVAAWQAAGWDNLFRAAWENGALLAGMCASAMAMCAGYGSCWLREHRAGPGLGLFPFSLACHADDPGRHGRHVLAQAVADGWLPEGYIMGDGAMISLQGTEIVEMVCDQRPGAWIQKLDVDPGSPAGFALHELPVTALVERAGEDFKQLTLADLVDRVRPPA